jgi:hypothetical protein
MKPTKHEVREASESHEIKENKVATLIETFGILNANYPHPS